MAKIDKSQYTKEEWHKIRAERRRKKEEDRQRKELEQRIKAQKSVKPATNLPQKSVEHKNYVVCLKWGNKYGADYVNKLYNMVSRNLTIPFEFVCFTENPRGIDENVKIMPLPSIKNVTGWWYKPMFFDKNLPLKGTILFMDLDVIVFENIDKLFTYEPGRFCIIRDFNRSLRRDWKRMNSSVFRLDVGSMPHIYDDFILTPDAHIRRLHGDQDWIYVKSKDTDYVFWPDDWIQSYKWEMRDRRELQKINGRRNFPRSGDPIVKKDTSIAVFHGEPYPHEVPDQWCKDNWK